MRALLRNYYTFTWHWPKARLDEYHQSELFSQRWAFDSTFSAVHGLYTKAPISQEGLTP